MLVIVTLIVTASDYISEKDLRAWAFGAATKSRRCLKHVLSSPFDLLSVLLGTPCIGHHSRRTRRKSLTCNTHNPLSSSTDLLSGS